MAVKAARLGRLRRSGAGEIGQAREVAFLEHKAPLVFIMQHVLTEQRVQAREARGNLGHARLLSRIEQCAGAHEVEMVAIEKPKLLGRETELVAALPQRVDAREEAGIEHNPAAVRRELWRVVPVERIERRVCRARGQVVEDAADAAQQPPAALQALDGISEIGRFGGAGDAVDFGDVLRHAAVEGGRKMLRPDTVEGRQLERRVPGFEERVFGHWCS